MTKLKQKGQHSSLEKTTHNRVLIETSDQATVLAQRWNCSKIEVYRWLVEMAVEGKATPPEASTGQPPETN